MLTVLFWNIQKKPLLDRVARIVRAHAVDVVVLAECVQTDAELLAALNTGLRGSPARAASRTSSGSHSRVRSFDCR
jgi:hypothetical protein